MSGLGDVLGSILSGVADEIRRGAGPVKWCKVCSRKHPSRQGCDLSTVAVKAKSGHMVKRRVHL